VPFDLEFDDDLAQRRLQRLEHRYRRAQNELATARSVYGSLRELSGASESQLHHALQQVERAQRNLADIQFDIEVAGAQMAAPTGHIDNDCWNDVVR
jgi:chromosome segregation ATPase